MTDSIHKENALMETAMCIAEEFMRQYTTGEIDESVTDSIGSYERYSIFRDYAREFEEKYCGLEEYENDWLGLVDNYSRQVVDEVFGAWKRR